MNVEEAAEWDDLDNWHVWFWLLTNAHQGVRGVVKQISNATLLGEKDRLFTAISVITKKKKKLETP